MKKSTELMDKCDHPKVSVWITFILSIVYFLIGIRITFYPVFDCLQSDYSHLWRIRDIVLMFLFLAIKFTFTKFYIIIPLGAISLLCLYFLFIITDKISHSIARNINMKDYIKHFETLSNEEKLQEINYIINRTDYPKNFPQEIIDFVEKKEFYKNELKEVKRKINREKADISVENILKKKFIIDKILKINNLNNEENIIFRQMNNEESYNYFSNKELIIKKINNTIYNLKLTRQKIKVLSSNIINLTSNATENEEVLNLANELKDLSLNLTSRIVYWNNVLKDYSRNFMAIKLGYEGEKRVNDELELYGDTIINLKGYRFVINGNSIETDNLVLTPFGIYSLEVKNMGANSRPNDAFIIEKDGRWLRKSNGTTEVVKNVTSQTYRHLALTQQLINGKLRELGINNNVLLKTFIVFANENIKIENNSDFPIVRISNMYYEMSKNPIIYDQNFLEIVKKILDENNNPPKKYDTVTIDNVENEINHIENIISTEFISIKELNNELDLLNKEL